MGEPFRVLSLFAGIGGFDLGLGNAVVPQIPELIGRAILAAEEAQQAKAA